MPPPMRRVMKCKRLALLQRIIVDEGYEDSELASDLAAGFSLVGAAPSSGGRLRSLSQQVFMWMSSWMGRQKLVWL